MSYANGTAHYSRSKLSTVQERSGTAHQPAGANITTTGYRHAPPASKQTVNIAAP
jgi:hypothetical protein